MAHLQDCQIGTPLGFFFPATLIYPPDIAPVLSATFRWFNKQYMVFSVYPGPIHRMALLNLCGNVWMETTIHQVLNFRSLQSFGVDIWGIMGICICNFPFGLPVLLLNRSRKSLYVRSETTIPGFLVTYYKCLIVLFFLPKSFI